MDRTGIELNGVTYRWPKRPVVIVCIGEAGDEALLGVVTLEILGVILNPFNRTLQPARLLLA